MASKKEALIDDAIAELKKRFEPMQRMYGSAVRFAVGIWDSLLAILLPMFLEWFTNCLKGPAAKKAAQIDDEMRRIALVNRGRRQERKLHRKAEKLFRKPEVIEANGGQELNEEEQDALYEEMVAYAFENRNTVAKYAATRG